MEVYKRNNILNLYNNKESFHKIYLHNSIDYVDISLNITVTSLNELFSQLSPLIIKATNYKHFDVSYDTSKEYIISYDHDTYTIRVSKSKNRFKPILLKLQHPDHKILIFFNNLLSQYNYHIMKVEFSYDFHSPDMWSTYNFLCKHLWLKYPGKEFDGEYETTQYLNDGYHSITKESKVYLKPIDDPLFSRFEIAFKRNLIKRNNLLSISTIDDILNTTHEDIMQFVNFKYFDQEMFYRKYHKFVRRGELKVDNYNEISNHIKLLINTKKLKVVDDFANRYVKRSCLNVHPFELKFRELLSNRLFLNGEILEIEPKWMEG